jgi:D-alanine-D-alanine ligase
MTTIHKKIRVAILFGGRSSEHEVSARSAKNVVDALDREKYEPVLIGIDRQGRWLPVKEATAPKMLGSGETALTPRASEEPFALAGAVDVVFPVLHGTFGEDGTVQGLLKLADVPFVGAGVLGSAVGMDKDVMKRLLRDAGLPIGDFVVLHRGRPKTNPDFAALTERLGLPFFIKPANLGSSVGVHKVADATQFEAAVADAFRFDHKLLAEAFIEGREIECSVLGDTDNPIASLPGEIEPNADFYSYEAKYTDESGTVLNIPANLPPNVTARVQELSLAAFQELCCDGMARVDFFLRTSGENMGDVVINEINTIPGFTNLSMYPKLWEVSGLSYAALIDRLIQLALERFERDRALETAAPLGLSSLKSPLPPSS